MAPAQLWRRGLREGLLVLLVLPLLPKLPAELPMLPELPLALLLPVAWLLRVVLLAVVVRPVLKPGTIRGSSRVRLVVRARDRACPRLAKGRYWGYLGWRPQLAVSL
jgi:hypothetical protein